MANKYENEQVVNRFLLSTTYALIAGLCLFYLSEAAGRGATALFALGVFVSFIVVGFVAMAWFLIRYFALKKGTLYYAVLFLLMGLSGVFLRYGNYIPGADSMTRRFVIVGIVLAAIYVYEVIVYFVRVNKVPGKKK